MKTFNRIVKNYINGVETKEALLGHVEHHLNWVIGNLHIYKKLK